MGLAAWMLDHDERSLALIARVFDGESEGLTRDDILDNVTLYWLTKTAVSSARLYWESKLAFFAPKGVPLPTAVSVFPDEIYAAPRSWAEQGVSEPDPLQPASQGRTLRRLGAAGGVLGRAPNRLQVPTLTGDAAIGLGRRSRMLEATENAPTIVLVHGAFADGSSWNGVIERLQQAGYIAIAPAIALRGVQRDSAYLGSVVSQIDGPVLLVGHSYGGALISNADTNPPNVVGLVFVAAFAPDTDEVLGEVTAESEDASS